MRWPWRKREPEMDHLTWEIPPQWDAPDLSIVSLQIMGGRQIKSLGERAVVVSLVILSDDSMVWLLAHPIGWRAARLDATAEYRVDEAFGGASLDGDELNAWWSEILRGVVDGRERARERGEL